MILAALSGVVYQASPSAVAAVMWRKNWKTDRRVGAVAGP
jgi:hypothetical protein